MKEEDREDAPEIWGQPQFILGGHQASMELVGEEVAVRARDRTPQGGAHADTGAIL